MRLLWNQFESVADEKVLIGEECSGRRGVPGPAAPLGGEECLCQRGEDERQQRWPPPGRLVKEECLGAVRQAVPGK